MDLTLEVAHLDHALRKESVEDALFVEQLCRDLRLHMTSKRLDIAGLTQECKANLEEVAREVRRDFLSTTALSRDCHLIALGHHADDQAETFMMRLLRGSSAEGLAGMRTANGSFVRPLLPFHRSEILAYLRQEAIPWREDQSNRDVVFTRNRIRHQLLPIMKNFNPNISKQLSSLCKQLHQDNDFWAELVDQELLRCGHWQEGSFVLDRHRLINLPAAVSGRVLRSALKLVRGDLRSITASHIEGALKLAHNGPPQGERSLPGVWLACRYDKLLLCKERPEAPVPFSLEVKRPGLYRLPKNRVLRVTLEDQPQGENDKCVEFSSAEVPFPLCIRHCQPGDRLRPSGMSGTKKVQDLFVDLKITNEQRQHALLLLKGEEVLWVLELRRSEGRKPLSGEFVLRIAIEP
jgi:tRNA(Ile)-lysidine synthase